MAKAKFYSLKEAAAKLGVSEDVVKQMASRGQLRQFRDRDQLMFRADEVDAMASSDESQANSGLPMADSGETGISLADSDDTGAITLGDTGASGDSAALPLADTGMQDTGEIKLSMDDSGDGVALSDSTGVDLSGTGDLSNTGLSGSTGGSSGLEGSGTDISMSTDAGSDSGLALADTGGDSGMELSDTGGDSGVMLSDSGLGATALEDNANEGSSGLGLALDDLGGSSGAAAATLGDSTGTDALSLTEEAAEARTPREDARQATGISVFDADEVEEADPMAQTLVTRATTEDEDLALESVGSGSGLLDLTRESDDTSLGAELLDEIYPSGGTEGAGGETKMDTAAGSSGVFDGAVTLEAAHSGSAADESAITAPPVARGRKAAMRDAPTIVEAAPVVEAAPAAPVAATTYVTVEATEPYDPAGDGLLAGLLIGAFISLILVLIVNISALFGASNLITLAMSASGGTLGLYALLLLALSAIFGVAGLFLNKMFNK
ncbi:MAG: helix-turn-helix domain-containing protein [Phycisphaeraceae bacterium]|nr:helix-turn-helix domain-containing protein [Phycisphaeraceae bacterium]